MVKDCIRPPAASPHWPVCWSASPAVHPTAATHRAWRSTVSRVASPPGQPWHGRSTALPGCGHEAPRAATPARQLVIAAIQSLAAGRPGLPGPSKSSPGTWPPASSGYALPWAGWGTKAGW
jgi:hypothetical protein